MKFQEKIRQHGFWALDYMTGSKVKADLNDIQYICNHFNSEQATQKRAAYLQQLLQHALNTTTYYKNKAYKQLSDFPVVNKNSIRTHKNDMLSTAFLNKKTFKIATSGSTGTPFTLVQDVAKKNRNTADTLYFSELAGFKLGYKLLYLRIWFANLKKSKLQSWLQNIIKIDVLQLNETGYLHKLLNSLKKDQSHKGWLGYASGFETLCKYLDHSKAQPIEANIKSIIAISEALNPYTKQQMAYYFKAPVVSRYSNWENGIIAQQPINGGTHFIINWASYHVEILDLEQDTPVASGALGRIVITDLFNYATPLIRYDTGDLGAIDHSVSPPVFTKIEGRRYDAIFDTRGEMVSPLLISGIVNYEGVLQGQLIQEQAKRYVLKLNITESFKQEAKLIADFKGYLGEDAEIILSYVNNIPLLSSGKRKIAINLHTQHTQ